MVAAIVLDWLQSGAAEGAASGRGLEIVAVILALVTAAAIGAVVLLVRELREQAEDGREAVEIEKAETKRERERAELAERGLQQAQIYEKHLQRVVRELQSSIGWGDSADKTHRLRNPGIHELRTKRWPTGQFEPVANEPRRLEDLEVTAADMVDANAATIPLPRRVATTPIPLVPADQVPTRDLRKRRRQPPSE